MRLSPRKVATRWAPCRIGSSRRRGALPRTRVDQIMNFAWKFMLPMAFTCLVSAAVWHYQGRGLAGWLWSLGVIVVVYVALSRLIDTRKKFATRIYRFAE